ncbi:hypothetical protein Fcan01_22416 [Folsomia candida]|uniref:Uncharacterized protein n=1 Tax=Folsomia candida TaxID=158441 RepID=A0A226DDG6_FOLCA|nr:hypothetical protein Fcan01_22416 [Folsomia candida]
MLVLWNHAVKYLSRVELDKLSPISEQISDHLIELRDYTFDCFVFSRDNVKTMARKLGLDHLQVAALEHNVAYVIRNWGKWEESVDLFRKVYDKFMTIEELGEIRPGLRLGNVIDGMRMELVYSKAMVSGVRGMAGLLKAQDEVFLGPLGWKM